MRSVVVCTTILPTQTVLTTRRLTYVDVTTPSYHGRSRTDWNWVVCTASQRSHVFRDRNDRTTRGRRGIYHFGCGPVQRRRRRGSGGGGRATAGDALRGRPRSPSSWAVTRAKTEAPSAAAEESLAKTVEAAAVAEGSPTNRRRPPNPVRPKRSWYRWVTVSGRRLWKTTKITTTMILPHRVPIIIIIIICNMLYDRRTYVLPPPRTISLRRDTYHKWIWFSTQSA